jgi:hypothetical protein
MKAYQEWQYILSPRIPTPVLKKVSDELYADVALPSARVPTGYVTGWPRRAGLDVPATKNFFFLDISNSKTVPRVKQYFTNSNGSLNSPVL